MSDYEPDSLMDQDHREWLEDRGSHQLEVEAYERERRGWRLHIEEGRLFIVAEAHWGAGTFVLKPMPLDDAVLLAHAILSEVEIATRGGT